MTLNLAGKTILIVDDEKFSRVTVARLLDEMGAPDVIHAADGREAMAALESSEQPIDLIISDFNMPQMHGLDLLKSVRLGGGGTARNLPFAMLTGYSDKHLVDLALALDVNAFLVKPVSKQALETRLAKMLSQAPAARALKSEDDYREIGVRSALENIVGLTEAAPADDDRPKARGVFVMKKDQPLFREPMGEDVIDDAAEAVRRLEGDEAEDQVEGDGYRCPLDQVPEGAVLARDIYTADGRLFMNAGQMLSARIISILIDLQDLGHPVESIWLRARSDG